MMDDSPLGPSQCWPLGRGWAAGPGWGWPLAGTKIPNTVLLVFFVFLFFFESGKITDVTYVEIRQYVETPHAIPTSIQAHRF